MSKKKDEQPPEGEIVLYVLDANGKPTIYNEKHELAITKEITKETKKIKGNNQLMNMEAEEIKAVLTQQQGAIQAIVDAMQEGVHFMNIDGIEGQTFTKVGADLLCRASGTRVDYELVELYRDLNNNIIDFTYKAIGYWGNKRIGEATANCNSLEDKFRKHFETYDKKTDSWTKKGSKSVYDIKNTLDQMAQKRAKVALARNIFAISGAVFATEDELKNPKAAKHLQQKVYRELYKYQLDKAPAAPTKKKLKNGTWLQYDVKKQLDIRKEWVRIKIFQPSCLAAGLPYYDFGTEDIPKVLELIPNMEVM